MQIDQIDHEQMARAVYEQVQREKQQEAEHGQIGVFKPVLDPVTQKANRFVFMWCSPDSDSCG